MGEESDGELRQPDPETHLHGWSGNASGKVQNKVDMAFSAT